MLFLLKQTDDFARLQNAHRIGPLALLAVAVVGQVEDVRSRTSESGVIVLKVIHVTFN